MIFAREVSDSLTSLVKKIDDACGSNKDARMGSFVVVLADDKDKMEAELKKMAEKEGLKKVVLTIDSTPGPTGYNIAKDADVTVLLYVKGTVKKNFAFKKGELTDAKIDEVLKEVPGILPEKK